MAGFSRSVLALVVFSLVFTFAQEAAARRVNAKFLLDFAPGIQVPIATAGYVAEVEPTFKHSLRIGAELWINRRFGIAGEGDFGLSPILFDDGGLGARVRFLLGFRLLFGFRVGAFFLRHAIGLDHAVRNVRAPQPGISSLGVEPGFGLQFYFARRGVAGFGVDLPTAFNNNTFSMDIQFLGFIGLRI
jgi:hypothetical protein